MAAAFLLVGQASTMGLMSTSMRPLLTAYTTTESRIPAKGTGSRSGRNASITNPAADRIWAATTQARYPTLSTNPVAARSTSSWVRKNTVGMRAISPSETLYVF